MPRKSFPAALKAAFPHTVPILTGYLAVGLAYGLLMASKGYNFLWSGNPVRRLLPGKWR